MELPLISSFWPLSLKGKVHFITVYEGPEGEYRYNSTPSSTLALMDVGG
jgi:hypothetical protein